MVEQLRSVQLAPLKAAPWPSEWLTALAQRDAVKINAQDLPAFFDVRVDNDFLFNDHNFKLFLKN